MSEAPKAEAARSALPKKFGRFEVLDILGKGGMAVVYLALDPIIGRKVALKVLRWDPLMESDERREMRNRFAQEFRAAGTLTHPNLVTIYDVSTDEDDATFIAMEYVDGESLRDLLKRGQELSDKDVAHLAVQLCAGLDYAHKAGIVHRDVKPANILLTKSGVPKITDFGVAKAKEATADLTQTGIVVGTPHYMSPEQVTGQELEGSSDQFSAAVILYQVLAGELPFRGTDPTSILYKIVHDDPIPPTQLNLALPARAEEVVLKALSKSPQNRYPSCTEFALELQDALGVEPLVATSPQSSESEAATRRVQQAVQESSRSAWLSLRSLLFVGLSLGLGALLGWFLLSNLEDSREAMHNTPQDLAQTIDQTTVTATLEIDGIEEGTEIWVDGIDSGVRSPSSVTLSGEQGTLVRIDLRRDGKSIDSRDFGLTGDPNLSWTASEPVAPETSPAPPKARESKPAPRVVAKSESFNISSTPPGASVLLDGVLLDQPTPTSVELTEGASYSITLHSEGFQDKTRTFDYPNGLSAQTLSAGTLVFDLEPIEVERPIPANPGFLRAGPLPYRITIEVAGETFGPDTELDIPLAAATYPEVRVTSDEVFFERTWKKLEIRTGEAVNLELPEATPVLISTYPENATVTIDGQAAGQSPFTRQLVLGRHEFIATWPDNGQRRVRKRITRRTEKVHITPEG